MAKTTGVRVKLVGTFSKRGSMEPLENEHLSTDMHVRHTLRDLRGTTTPVVDAQSALRFDAAALAGFAAVGLAPIPTSPLKREALRPRRTPPVRIPSERKSFSSALPS